MIVPLYIVIISTVIGIAVGAGAVLALQAFTKRERAPEQNVTDDQLILASLPPMDPMATKLVEDAQKLQKEVQALGPQPIVYGTRTSEVAFEEEKTEPSPPPLSDAAISIRPTADELRVQAEEQARRMLNESQSTPDPHEQHADPANALLSPQPASIKEEDEPPVTAAPPKGRKKRSLIRK